MGVHMPDRLPGFGTGVEHEPVPAVGDALRDGDLVRLGDELVEQAVTGAGQGGDVRVVVARDYQDVRGRLRVDVPESEDPLTVKHHRGRDLPGRDTAEQALWHTTIIVAGRRWRVQDLALGLSAGAALGSLGDACGRGNELTQKLRITHR